MSEPTDPTDQLLPDEDELPHENLVDDEVDLVDLEYDAGEINRILGLGERHYTMRLHMDAEWDLPGPRRPRGGSKGRVYGSATIDWQFGIDGVRTDQDLRELCAGLGGSLYKELEPRLRHLWADHRGR